MGNNLQFFCTGSSGLVASKLKEEALNKDIPFLGIDLNGEGESINILDQNQLETYVKNNIIPNKTPVLFHFAAITLTGNKLTPEQIALTKSVNVDGTKSIVAVSKKLNIPLIHISTDFVFSGANKTTPYNPNDTQIPDSNIYAKTKVEAEKIVLNSKSNNLVSIIRIAFPYGNLKHPKPGLFRKMMQWMDEKSEVNLYNDQKICPTPIDYITQSCLKTANLISQNQISSGTILHVVGNPTTPYEFGSLIKEIYNKKSNLKPVSVEGKAPKNLVLQTQETETLLNLKALSHRQYLEALKT
jgi:dTDP-4-dehydrorhamnose reductase